MELLARLLGGTERVKIMRFFLHHEDAIVSLHDISEKTKSKSAATRKELAVLSSIGFIEKKKTRTVTTSGSGKKATSKVKEVVGFKLNTEFPHNQALKDLLFDFQLLDKRELANRFKVVGRIKLFIVAGVFPCSSGIFPAGVLFRIPSICPMAKAPELGGGKPQT